MPKIFPTISHSINWNKGEDLVYSALSAKLPDDYILIYSKNLTDRNRFGEIVDREIDFIIFSPKDGLLVVEVKGGIISRKSDTWYQNQRAMNKNPITQIRNNFHTLEKILKKDSVLMQMPLQYALWFPETETSNDWRQIKNEIQWIFFKSDLYDPLQKINLALQSTGKKLAEINGIAERLTNLLCPDLGQVAYQVKANGNIENRILQLTDNQLKIVDFIENETNAVIQGGAGTGKSIVAIFLAQRERSAGQKVLILVYNALLRKYLETALMNKEGIAVHTPKSLCIELKISTDKDESPYVCLGKLRDYIDRINIPFKYDTVIIDEAQDFTKDFIETVYLHLNVYEDRRKSLFCFIDESQSIQVGADRDYSWKNSFENVINLRRNCRNTKQIYDYSIKFLEGEQKLIKKKWIGDTLPNGDEVTEYKYTDYNTDLKSRIKDILKEEFAKGAKKEEILIGRIAKSEGMLYYNDIKINGKNIEFSKDFKPGTILSTTVRRLKGLESKVVILVSDDSHLSINLNWDLYTACTRAKERLHVIYKAS